MSDNGGAVVTRSIGFLSRDKPVDREVAMSGTTSRSESSVRPGIQVEALVVRGRVLFGVVIVVGIDVLFLKRS